jgi:hypothetical protein
MLADAGLPKQQGAVFILAERLLGFAALLLLALTGIAAYRVPAHLGAMVIGLALLGVVVALGSRALARMARRRLPNLERAADAVELLRRHPLALVRVLLASLVFQVASIALTWVVALAFGIEVPFLACLALVPLVWVVTMLPISLGGVGLREASFAYLFGAIGLSIEQSLLLSLGTWAALLFIGAIGGVIFLFDPPVKRARGIRSEQP